MYSIWMTIGIISILIFIAILITVFTIVEYNKEPKTLFFLFLELIPIVMFIVSCNICDKYEYEQVEKEYNACVENIRVAEAEMAKFLVLHPEFKDKEIK